MHARVDCDALDRTGPHLEDNDVYAFTLRGALDQLRHGITATLNPSQTVAPPDDP